MSSEVKPILAASSLMGVGHPSYESTAPPVDQYANLTSASGIAKKKVDDESSETNQTPDIRDIRPKKPSSSYFREMGEASDSEDDDDDEDDNADHKDPHYEFYQKFESHPTHRSYQTGSCACPSFISTPMLLGFCFIFAVNLVCTLIWVVDDDVYFAGAYVQEWLVVFDAACGLLVLVYLMVKIVDWSITQIHDYMVHPLVEFTVIHWHMYEASIIGLAWGTLCGLAWGLYSDLSKNNGVSSRMDQLVHDLIIAILLLSGLIALKVLIISTYETRLYRDFRHLIALSLREEKVITEIESKLFAREDDRLIAKKFKEIDLRRYMARSPFQVPQDPTHRITEAPEHVRLSVASAMFAQELVERSSSHQDGFLREEDFIRLSRLSNSSETFFQEMFDFLDTDKDGRVCGPDIQVALAHILKMRKEIRQTMRSRRVLLEITNSIINAVILFLASIVVLVYVFEIDLIQFAVPFTSLVLALSFAYQRLLQDLFDNLYTLYFVRPCNIGDFVEIDGDRYYIEEVGLLSTALISRVGDVVYMRNTLMREQPFHNLRRGRWVKIRLKMYILTTTTFDQLEDFKRKITFFCAQSQIFSKRIACFVEEDMNPGPCLLIIAKLKGYANWQQKRKWQTARTQLMLAASNFATDMGILDNRNTLRVEGQGRKGAKGAENF